MGYLGVDSLNHVKTDRTLNASLTLQTSQNEIG